MPSGSLPGTYDVVFSGIKGEVLVFDFGLVLNGHRPDFDKLFKDTEGQPLTIKSGKTIFDAVAQLKEEGYSNIQPGNSTEAGHENSGTKAIEYRDQLLREGIERRRITENIPKLRKKSADSLTSLITSSYPDFNPAFAPVAQPTATMTPSPTPQPGPV